MWLTGKTEALLCYCLVNTPLEIVEDEIRREHWKQFKIERDETVIWEIQNKVEEARIYFNQLIETI